MARRAIGMAQTIYSSAEIPSPRMDRRCRHPRLFIQLLVRPPHLSIRRPADPQISTLAS